MNEMNTKEILEKKNNSNKRDLYKLIPSQKKKTNSHHSNAFNITQ